MEKPIYVYGEKELAYLQKKDKKLGLAIERIGPVKREITKDLFTALVDSVVSQQISTKAAQTVYGRLSGMSDMTPESLDRLDAADIQKAGMSMIKAGYIKNIAKAVLTKEVDIDRFSVMTDQEIIIALTSIKGVGVWTAEMMLIFSLSRPDVVSYGDLAIRRGMMNLYGHKELTRERFNVYKKRYSPYGTVASLYLWELSAD